MIKILHYMDYAICRKMFILIQLSLTEERTDSGAY